MNRSVRSRPVRYYYDGQGNRIQKSVVGETATTYVHDAFGVLAAEYSSTAITPACVTCYLVYDHLGSVRLVTDQASNVVARHDYVPYGQEIPNGTGGRSGNNFGVTGNVNQMFTGQERDPEMTPNTDFFNARYFSAVAGSFLRPDPGNAGASLSNPQSWNGYAYVSGNPMNSVDPSGKSCVKLDETDDDDNPMFSDDGDGQGCEAAGVKPGSTDNPSTLNQGQVNANATAQNPSDFEYLWTISTNEIPRYYPNDVPLNDYASKVVTRIGQILPTVCGGGVYYYVGRAVQSDNAHAFLGTIWESDSREGPSTGILVEVGGGANGIEGGLGYIATANSKGQVSSSFLGFVGVGVHSESASASVGVVGFSGGAGLYADGSLRGIAGGVGVYGSKITSNAACQASQK